MTNSAVSLTVDLVEINIRHAFGISNEHHRVENCLCHNFKKVECNSTTYTKLLQCPLPHKTAGSSAVCTVEVQHLQCKALRFGMSPAITRPA